MAGRQPVRRSAFLATSRGHARLAVPRNQGDTMSRTLMIVCTVVLMATQLGVGYWIVAAIEATRPSAAAAASVMLQTAQTQELLQQIVANTNAMKGDLDELAPGAASKRPLPTF